MKEVTRYLSIVAEGTVAFESIKTTDGEFLSLPTTQVLLVVVVAPGLSLLLLC
jgi:hypothetical protein